MIVGAGEIHTSARARNFLALRLLEILRARACVFRPPHNRHIQDYSQSTIPLMRFSNEHGKSKPKVIILTNQSQLERNT